jgi:Uma2 family endonuclease
MTETSFQALAPAFDLGNRSRKKWTSAEVRRLYDLGALTPNDRLELLNGELVEKMGMKGPHAIVLNLLQVLLMSLFGEGYVIRQQQPLVVAEGSEPEPDFAVVAGNARDFVENPSQALLAVEVSDSTLSYDLGGKAALYAQAGVEDYWVVDINSRLLYVHRTPIVSPALPGGAGYQTITRLTETDRITPLAAPRNSFLVADILP